LRKQLTCLSLILAIFQFVPFVRGFGAAIVRFTDVDDDERSI
jgi:hypothetical protein